MRILFSACPMSGHVATILPLVLAARAAGHEVVVASGAGVVPHLRRHGVETWAVGPAEPASSGGGSAAQRAAFFAHSAAPRAEDLVPRAARWLPDLVVSETTELAGAAAAAVTGARYVVHGLGAMPSMGIWDAYAMHLDGLFARWGVGAPAESVRAAAYLEVCPPALRGGGPHIWRHTLDLRPTPVPEGGAPVQIDLLPYRDTILVHPGTVTDGLAVLAGLQCVDANVVVRADPAPYGRQPAHVLISPLLPDAPVLPRCRLVISPGGPGITLAALAHGLPHLILTPERADEAVVHAGAALALAAVTPEAVARAVPRLLTDPSFAASAAWVQVEIASMSPPDAVVRALTGSAASSSAGSLVALR
jgi:UDP:flavonoid glycosyltransferase YjiC (YdhE family)